MTWEHWHDLGDSFVPFLYHQVYLWENSKCGNCKLFYVFWTGQNHCWPSCQTLVKTIEKPLMSMVNQWKNIQWWWFSGNKTIEKPLIAMVPSKKFITIPSLWKYDHRWSLFQSIQTIYFLWGYDPGNMSVSTYLLLLSWAPTLLFHQTNKSLTTSIWEFFQGIFHRSSSVQNFSSIQILVWKSDNLMSFICLSTIQSGN